MSRKIITVEESFSLVRIIVVGRKDEDFPDIKIGTSVEILRPDGTKINSQITGIEMPIFRSFSEENLKRKIGFMLKGVTKEDVPNESVLYACD